MARSWCTHFSITGHDPNARTTRDSRQNTMSGVSLKGATPLFLAASLGHVETVRALVAGGADPFHHDRRKAPPPCTSPLGEADPYFRDWTEDEKKNLFEMTKLLVGAGRRCQFGRRARLDGAARSRLQRVWMRWSSFLSTGRTDRRSSTSTGRRRLSIANAVITVGSKDAYYQSSRVVRKSTSDLLSETRGHASGRVGRPDTGSVLQTAVTGVSALSRCSRGRVIARPYETVSTLHCRDGPHC